MNKPTYVRCEMHDADCMLYQCVSEGRCKLKPLPAADYAAQIAALPTRLPETPQSTVKPEMSERSQKIGPRGEVCQRQVNYVGNGMCQRVDCDSANMCRYGFKYLHGTTVDYMVADPTCPDSGVRMDGTQAHPGQVTGKQEWKTPPSHTYTPAPPCHAGWVHIGNIGKARIHLGKQAALVSNCVTPGAEPIALAIDLVDMGEIPQIGAWLTRANDAAGFLPSYLLWNEGTVPTLEIAWPDFGVVALPRKWWEELIKALRELEGDVVIYCVGGHGRTGTFASILVALSGILPADEPCPVRWLRRIYCNNIVESQKQLDYIGEMTCLTITARTRDYAILYGQYEHVPHKYMQGQGRLPLPLPTSTPSTPVLSNNRYKAAVSRYAKKGIQLTPFKMLEDREVLYLDGNVFQWDGILRIWEYLRKAEDDNEPDPTSDLVTLIGEEEADRLSGYAEFSEEKDETENE